jgi:hypothetical protein
MKEVALNQIIIGKSVVTNCNPFTKQGVRVLRKTLALEPGQDSESGNTSLMK